MSFLPLPKTLLDLLAGLRPTDAVVDLGCGDGDFGCLLHEHGITSIGLDILNWGNQGPVQIVGDVRVLPLGFGRVHLLLAANLVRHVLVQDPTACFLKHWFATLQPGGRIFICEDEPESGSAAVKNYHRVQELLRRALPGRRGPLLGLGVFRELVADLQLVGCWSFGQGKNNYPADSDEVLRFLRGAGDFSPAGEVACLVADISKYGLDYGRFWWACWQKDA